HAHDKADCWLSRNRIGRERGSQLCASFVPVRGADHVSGLAEVLKQNGVGRAVRFSTRNNLGRLYCGHDLRVRSGGLQERPVALVGREVQSTQANVTDNVFGEDIAGNQGEQLALAERPGTRARLSCERENADEHRERKQRQTESVSFHEASLKPSNRNRRLDYF